MKQTLLHFLKNNYRDYGKGSVRRSSAKSRSLKLLSRLSQSIAVLSKKQMLKEMGARLKPELRRQIYISDKLVTIIFDLFEFRYEFIDSFWFWINL